MPAIAPLVAGWQRRIRGGFGAPLGGAEPVMGMPILTSTYANARMLIEIAFGAVLSNPEVSWIWYDVTTDVSQANGRNVTITVGGQDEQVQTAPAGCEFVLKNVSGVYTPYNAFGQYWPNVKRNTPIRVRLSLDGGITWVTRFEGYANGFTPSWDQSLKVAIITVDASGVLRRVQQGNTPLKSALTRAILTAGPLEYWPMTDGTGATQAVNLANQANPMLPTSSGSVSFSSITGPDGDSTSLPDFGSTTIQDSISGKIVDDTGSSWTIEWVAKANAGVGAAVGWQMLDWTSANLTWGAQIINSPDNDVIVFGFLPSAPIPAVISIDTIMPASLVDDEWHGYRVTLSQNGLFMTLTVYVDGVQVGTSTVSGIAGALRTIDGVSSMLNGTAALGHLSIYAGIDGISASAVTGYTGETPRARLTRLCLEENMPFEVVNFYSSDKTMGPQSINTFPNLLRECELVDAGFLYDGFTAGLRYQGISQRYDQALALSLDVSNRDLPNLTPADNDQRNLNLVTVSRPNGSSAAAQDVNGPLGTDSIGVYDSSLQINAENDSALFNRASWEVHAGTVEGFRYPTLTLQLTDKPGLAARWLTRADAWPGPVIPGSRVDVANVSTLIAQHPIGTVSLTLLGYTEQISGTEWNVTTNCSPNSVYDVFKVSDTRLGRVGHSVSTVATDAPVGSTTLSIETPTENALWTTTATFPSDFPFDINVDGVQVTVTGISGTSSPQTFTVSPTSRLFLIDCSVKLWKPGVIKL